MIKKLKHKIRLKLAYWHRKRANELFVKELGATYYLQYKTQLSSTYGINGTGRADLRKAFYSGYTNMYADTDSVKEGTNGKV